MRGARAAASSANPDLAIVAEGAPADDLPGTSRARPAGRPRFGSQIRLMDSSAIMNRKFTEFVIETAEKNGIPYQVAVRKKGGTDAGPIHLHASGVPTVVFAVPSRYIHTHNTIIDISDYLNALKLILKLVETIDGDSAANISSFCD